MATSRRAGALMPSNQKSGTLIDCQRRTISECWTLDDVVVVVVFMALSPSTGKMVPKAALTGCQRMRGGPKARRSEFKKSSAGLEAKSGEGGGGGRDQQLHFFFLPINPQGYPPPSPHPLYAKNTNSIN